MKIKSIKKVPFVGYVYNLGVEKVHNYYCQGMLVSNCYAKGNPKGVHYTNTAQKIKDFFGPMTENQRPYQVAIGGSQEPLEHPEFADALKTFCDLGIVPNYTTNGVLFNEQSVELTKKYCGGIAITCHPHLREHWTAAIDLALKNGLRINLHIMLSDATSIEYAKVIYNEYNGKVDYFVLLPHMNVGFASHNPKIINYDLIETWLDEVSTFGNIAFGANFYQFLKRKKKWDISLYPPEILSKYLVCDDLMSIYNNSFDATTDFV